MNKKLALVSIMAMALGVPEAYGGNSIPRCQRTEPDWKRKLCKSCKLFKSCIRDTFHGRDFSPKPLDKACSKYIKK